MKKFYKVLAAVFALSIVLAAPDTCITSHAFGFDGDATYYDGDSTMPDNYWDDNSSSESNESASAPSSSGSGSSGGGSEYGSGMGFNPDAQMYDGDSTMPSDYWSNSSAPANDPNDVTVGTTGGQKFRIVMNKDHTAYEVYHCGVSKMALAVTDKDGNKVAYKNVTLEQGEDNLWYENITLAQGVDATGLSVTVTRGDVTYLKTELGVSGIKLNGVLMVSTAPAADAKK